MTFTRDRRKGMQDTDKRRRFASLTAPHPDPRRADWFVINFDSTIITGDRVMRFPRTSSELKTEDESFKSVTKYNGS